MSGPFPGLQTRRTDLPLKPPLPLVRDPFTRPVFMGRPPERPLCPFGSPKICPRVSRRPNVKSRPRPRSHVQLNLLGSPGDSGGPLSTSRPHPVLNSPHHTSGDPVSTKDSTLPPRSKIALPISPPRRPGPDSTPRLGTLVLSRLPVPLFPLNPVWTDSPHTSDGKGGQSPNPRSRFGPGRVGSRERRSKVTGDVGRVGGGR